MIVETTNYYARPDHVEEVLAQRRQATGLRVAMGLPAGQIFVKKSGPGPDVRWECRFPSEADYMADMQARANNPEFAAGRKQMHEFLTHFERHVETEVPDQANPAT